VKLGVNAEAAGLSEDPKTDEAGEAVGLSSGTNML